MSNPTKVAAILVGGKGTRLRSLISDVPKPLAPIDQQPFLFLILRQLQKLGISRVILLTGYLHEKIVAACGDGRQFGLDIIYSEEKNPLGTAGAILNARDHLEKYEDFILMNGDTYLDCPLENFFASPLNEEVGLIGALLSENERFSRLQVHPKTHRIESFASSQVSEKYFVNAGIYRLSSAIFNRISPNQFSSLEGDIFPRMIAEGVALKAFPLMGEFIDIGVPESYLAFNQRVIQGRI